jgi:putative NADH-flavin reductase
MNLFLLGATGRTGQLVLDQAPSRGHAVTAIIRQPEAFHAHGRSHIVVGDPLRADVMAQVLANQDAVVSCLGQRSRRDANLLRDAAVAVLAAMARAGVRRYLVVSLGLLFPSWNPILALLRLILARHIADSAAMERLVCASNVDWTIVRPPRLKVGGDPRGYRVQTGARPAGAWAMQRADLAAFLLDEVEREEHKKEIVGITSA